MKAAAKNFELDAPLASACAEDVKKYCAGVARGRGRGRVHACLKKHARDVSRECAAAREAAEKEADFVDDARSPRDDDDDDEPRKMGSERFWDKASASAEERLKMKGAEMSDEQKETLLGAVDAFHERGARARGERVGPGPAADALDADADGGAVRDRAHRGRGRARRRGRGVLRRATVPDAPREDAQEHSDVREQEQDDGARVSAERETFVTSVLTSHSYCYTRRLFSPLASLYCTREKECHAVAGFRARSDQYSSMSMSSTNDSSAHPGPPPSSSSSAVLLTARHEKYSMRFSFRL